MHPYQPTGKPSLRTSWLLAVIVLTAVLVSQSTATVISLGTAQQYTVLALDGSTVFMGNDPTTVFGDYGIGPNSDGDLSKGTITGTLYIDPTSDPNVTVTANIGGKVVQNMTQPVNDAVTASAAFAALATNRFDVTQLTTTQTIVGNGGDNVFSISSVTLNSKTLTLQGTPDDFFIFNVTGDFFFASSNVVLTGGLTTSHVMFNVVGADPGNPIELRNSGTFRGTVLAPDRAIHADHLTIVGALIGGRDSVLNTADKDGADLSLHSEVQVQYAPFEPGIPGPEPCISVTKSVIPIQAEVGEQVTYTFVVENCGNVPLINITLIDDVFGNLTGLLPTTTLSAGQSTSFNYNYIIQNSDPDPLNNVVTVQGTSPQDVTVMDTDDATVDILPPPPPNLVSISGGSFNDLNGNGVLDPGEPPLAGATFTLTDCMGNPVTDAFGMAVGPQIGSTYNFTNLNPGCYIVIETNPAGFVSTNAIPGSCVGSVKVNNDKIQVQANTPGVACINNNFLDWQAAPCITVTKTVDPTQLLASTGGPVTYAFTVTNCGNVLLSNVTVNDDVVPGVNAAFLLADPAATLAPGASVMFTVGYMVPASPPSPDPLVNTVTATGTDPLGTVVDDTAQTQVDFIPVVQNNSVTIAGGAFQDLDCSGTLDPGEPPLENATFTIVRCNGMPATDIFGNPVAPQTGSSYEFTNLVPGRCYVVTETNPAGYISSAAIPGSCTGTVAVDADTLQIPAQVANTACINNDFLDCRGEGCIEITKSVSPDHGVVGTPIVYTFTVHNCGNLDLTITSLTDTVLGDLLAAFVADHGSNVLAAGASETFTVNSTIPGNQGNPVVNVVTVIGTGPDGTPYTDHDDATVAIPVSICGGAFNDTECDGILDNDDLPLAGATFVLTDINGNPVTDINGNPVTAQMGSTFCFINLAPRIYKVTEINPMGYTSTNAIPGTGGTKLTNDMIRVDAVGGVTFLDQNFLDGQCEQLVYQAYPGNSYGTNLGSAGFAGPTGDLTTSVPGVLQIIPQDDSEPAWANFIRGYLEGTYTSSGQLKNVTLTKQTPELIQCADVFPGRTIRQQGTANIRLWWPLMYEIPGTTWTLEILWGSSTPPYVNTETWVWRMDATLQSLKDTLQLFHELPYGRTETPLVSDECLYPVLQAKLDAIIDAINNSNLELAGQILGDFEMEVSDAWLTTVPQNPNPCGPGTGIVQTAENPAVCKLLSDAGYIGATYGIWSTAK